MKRYFKNLWLALTGANPYSDELQDAKDKLNKAADNVQALHEQLYAAMDNWNNSAVNAEELKKKLEAEKRTVHDFEVLVENLRERINEKDTLMERMKQDYQQRIAQYTQEIEELQEKSQSNQ